MHDQFRKVPGAFKGALNGIDHLRKEGIEFQINTTITKHNVQHIEKMLEMAVEIGAVAHHIFLLIFLCVDLLISHLLGPTGWYE